MIIARAHVFITVGVEDQLQVMVSSIKVQMAHWGHRRCVCFSSNLFTYSHWVTCDLIRNKLQTRNRINQHGTTKDNSRQSNVLVIMYHIIRLYRANIKLSYSCSYGSARLLSEYWNWAYTKVVCFYSRPLFSFKYSNYSVVPDNYIKASETNHQLPRDFTFQAVCYITACVSW